MSITILGTRSLPDALRIIPARVGPRPEPEHIRRRELPYWQDRGWIRQGETFIGTYQTPYGSFRGLVEDRGWNHFRFYIFDPPGEVKRSGHWACFQPRGKKGFLVHMARRPADVSSGIMTIERLIAEAYER